MSNIEIIGNFNFPKEKITQEILTLIQNRLLFISSEKKKIQEEISKFQIIYKKTNEEIVEEFQEGSLGDEEDYFVWTSSIDILKELTEEENLLKDLL